MLRIKILKYFLIFFFLLNDSQLYGKISNSVVITVGNLPITYLDIVKEMTFVSIISKNKLDDSNKEQIKNIAAKSLIQRKIKELEINKHKVKNFSRVDLEKLTKKIYLNLGTNKDGLKKILEINNLNFEDLEKRFEIDLKWNTLIFELYKNKVVLNMNEIEEKINSEIMKLDRKNTVLLSEIEVSLPEKNLQLFIDKIKEDISNEGFENIAKKISISESAEKGGNLGWIDESKLSNKIFENIKEIKVNEIGEAIILENSLIIIKKNGEKLKDQDFENIKNRIIRTEKEKKLKMFSNSHYSNLERITQINFL